ncbi:MAG: hypothetical protein IPM82_06175 [Saprospiraceae bacterium]|nr:hypothetical protein [Saprospiraceae bacterium]
MKNANSVITLSCFILLKIGCGQPSANEEKYQGVNHLAVIKQFLEARKLKDKDTYMRMVAPGMKVWYEEKKGKGKDWNPESAWTKWDEFFNAEKRYSVFTQDSNAVTVIVYEINDFYKLIDREESPVRLTWWLNSEGKIEGYLVKSLSSSTAFGSLNAFEAWAKENHPAELAYLMPDGNINPEGDRPARWKKILLDWREKNGLPDLGIY